ncbi:MAG: 30S ribosomal protein S4 [Clostridia bacterium]|nr:30S ribosomal protein S4 [Oscillospiraceae bacterium]MBQ7032797.1 30S ribosomal protein S4 [Clostridia bacterium]
MARNMQPILKRCRTLGIEPSVMGIHKTSNRNPKPMKRKQSEYGRQLTEKQKVKFIYGMLEKQFRKYYEIAVKMPGITGENLLTLLESRLDNVVFRLCFANTRRESRQMVNHGHILVNGKRVDIPSYRVKEGDVISIAEKSKGMAGIKNILEKTEGRVTPKWLELDRENATGKVITLAKRDDIDFEVQETLIVELYSK